MNIKKLLFAAAFILLSLFAFQFYSNHPAFSTSITQHNSNNFIIKTKVFLSGLINKKNSDKQAVDAKQEDTVFTSNQNNIEEAKTIELSNVIGMLEEYVSLTENTLPNDENGFDNNVSINLFIGSLNRSDFLQKNIDLKFAIIKLMRLITNAKIPFKNLYLRSSNLQTAKKSSLESNQDFLEKQNVRKNNLQTDITIQKEKFKENITANLRDIKIAAENKTSKQVLPTDAFFLSTKSLVESAKKIKWSTDEKAKKMKWIAENSKVLMLRVDSIDGDTLYATELRTVVIGGGRVSRMASVGGGSGGGGIVYEPTNVIVTVTGVPNTLKKLKQCSIEVYPEPPENSEQKNRYVFVKLMQ
jgi:hypothetical protein